MATVFLVDDDLAFLESIKDFPLRGIELTTFSDPVQALKSLRSSQPDILISDVQMPGVHGLDFCFIAREIIAHQKVILISANSLADIQAKYGSIGDLKFYQKPLEEN